MSDGTQGPLPLGWAEATLGDVRQNRSVSILPGRTPNEIFELYSVPSHSSGSPEILSGEKIGSNKQTVESDTVLLCKINPRINRVWVVGNYSIHRKIASTEWIPFFPVQGVLSKYLCYYMRQNAFRDHLATQASGVGGSLMRVKGSIADPYRFPLAPQREQRRIVAELERELTRLDAAVAALKRVQASLKRYRASVLKAACEGRLVPTEAELARREGRPFEPVDQLLARILKERRAKWEADQLAKMHAAGKPPKDDKWKAKYPEPIAPDASSLPELPEGWVWASVDQLGSSEPNAITDGPFGSNLKTSHYTEDGPRVIRLQNVGDGVFVDARAHISEGHFESLSKHRIEAGDLVIASLGERPPRACIIPPYVGCAIVKADCIRFKPEPKLAEAGYLNLALNSEPTRTRASAIVHGVGRPRLSLEKIRAIVLPAPPPAEQRRILFEAEDRLSYAGRLEKVVESNLKRGDRLRQAILSRAFEGRLVPQDPNDEPASALLERIRAERTEAKQAAVLNRDAGKVRSRGESSA